MDLKDFIKETMIEIGESVVEIQKHFDNNNIDAIVNPREIRINYNSNYSAEYSATSVDSKGNRHTRTNAPRMVDNIEFDVAITVETDSKNAIGGKLKIFDIGIGAEANELNKLANVSKVKFKIPLVLPHGRENKS